MPTCPTCKSQLLRISGTNRFTCVSGCTELAAAAPSRSQHLHAGGPEVALKLPGLDSGRQAVQVKQPEKEVQRSIVQALRARGYIVQETSEARRRVQCPPQLSEAEARRGERAGCGKWFFPAGGRPGMTKGLSDLLVRNPRWCRWVWCAIEVKGGDSPSRQEQIKLAQDGHTRIVWSVVEALEVVSEMDRVLLGGADD